MLRTKTYRNLLSLLAIGGPLIGCGTRTNFTNVGRNVTPANAYEGMEAEPQYLRTFTAGNLETADITIDSGFELISQEFQLHQEPKTEDLHQQLNRTLHEDSFTQGNSGINAQQSFAIAEAGIFDLLIVIDNSSSMAPYQNRLGKTLPSLLKHISNTNWKIAVVTTTSACLNKSASGQKYITRADYDADPVKTEEDFKYLINVGEFGDSVEKGILVATNAMTGQGCARESNTWLRPDSQRAILLVTDEQNCGSASNEGCPGQPYEKTQYFFDRVGSNVMVNGLLLLQEPPAADSNNPADPNHDCENSGGYADLPNPAEYISMIQGTSGIFSDICRSSYSTVLEQISLNVGKKINIQYELAYPAVAANTMIKIDGKPVKNFTVSGKTLTVLDVVPAASSSLEISYKHTPVPMKKEFTPGAEYDASTFEVLVNNERLDASEYQYNAGTKAVELKNLPPENANVKVRYRHDSPLIRSFAFSKDFVEGSIEVMVDNKATNKFVVDPTTKRIIFEEAPSDSASIRLRYELPGDRKTSYPVLGAFPDAIETLELSDAESGAPIEVSLDQGQLQVDAASVQEGRKVRARYNLNYPIDSKIFTTKIKDAPFPGTVQIEAGGAKDVCTKDLTVHADQLSFGCTDEDFEAVHVSYQYASDYKNTFDLDLAYSGPRSYTVYVNNQTLEDYHIVGEQLVILKKYLPPGAEVKVLITPL